MDIYYLFCNTVNEVFASNFRYIARLVIVMFSHFFDIISVSDWEYAVLLAISEVKIHNTFFFPFLECVWVHKQIFYRLNLVIVWICGWVDMFMTFWMKHWLIEKKTRLVSTHSSSNVFPIFLTLQNTKFVCKTGVCLSDFIVRDQSLSVEQFLQFWTQENSYRVLNPENMSDEGVIHSPIY